MSTTFPWPVDNTTRPHDDVGLGGMRRRERPAPGRADVDELIQSFAAPKLKEMPFLQVPSVVRAHRKQWQRVGFQGNSQTALQSEV